MIRQRRRLALVAALGVAAIAATAQLLVTSRRLAGALELLAEHDEAMAAAVRLAKATGAAEAAAVRWPVVYHTSPTELS